MTSYIKDGFLCRATNVTKYTVEVSLETLSDSSQLVTAIADSLSRLDFVSPSKDTILASVLKNGDSGNGSAVVLEAVRVVSPSQGSLPGALRNVLWTSLNFMHTETLRSNEDVESLLYVENLLALSRLKELDLSGSGISSLPGEVFSSLVNLEHLDVSRNEISILPREIGIAKNLKCLLARENNMTILPGEMSVCESLQVLDLSSNRLASILISFANMKNLTSLLLDDNPLESFPDISSCLRLKKISFSRVVIESDNDHSTKVTCSFDVKQPSKSLVINFFGAKESEPVQEFYDLALRGSNHHPLVIEGIRVMLGSSAYRAAFLNNDQTLSKVALMTLSENAALVISACKILSILCENDRSAASNILKDHGEMLFSLLKWSDERQIETLNTIEIGTRFCSFGDSFNSKLIDWSLVSLEYAGNLVSTKVALLRVLGNLASCECGRNQLLADRRFIQEMQGIVADGQDGSTRDGLYLASRRLLSSLGLHNIPPRKIRGDIVSKGKRILSLDGGGMKGLATVRLLRMIELKAKQPLRDLFDLVVGTSTGALLAVALMLKGMNLEECEAVYKELGKKVFQRPVHSSENDESWMSVFYRSLHMKTEHVRAVVVGCKHDTVIYEHMLKEKCHIPAIGSYKIESLIDTSALDVPKIALVSTLTSVSPAQPFIFRNYEYSTESVINRMGTSSSAVWEAVRASSAAIYYLDTFECRGNKFQDGALVANNPSLIALQESYQIWPDNKIELLVSVGTGSSPVCPRQGGMSSYMETGSALLESATNVEEVHRALTVISNLLPEMKYFRLNPVDPRCEMDLDCVDPQKWIDLEAASDEYVSQVCDTYQEIVDALVN